LNGRYAPVIGKGPKSNPRCLTTPKDPTLEHNDSTFVPGFHSLQYEHLFIIQHLDSRLGVAAAFTRNKVNVYVIANCPSEPAIQC
jgi:hypothetical protein